MKLLASAVSLLAAVISAVQAVSVSGPRLLAVLDDLADKEAYSTFLGDLESRGFSLTYETAKSSSVSLFRLGERAYDHVIFFPTKAKGLGPNLTPQLLVQFLNSEGNILVALSSNNAASSSIVSLLSELDISLPTDRTGLVVDHFNYDTTAAADLHDVLLLPVPAAREGVKSLFDTEASASGEQLLAFPHTTGHTLGDSPFLAPIVSAPRTAYSYNPKEQADAVAGGADGDLFASGAQLKLVSGLQARNSARFVLLGSAELLSNTWFDAKVQLPAAGAKAVTTYNREFARRLTGWTFQETGVVRVNWIEHHLNEKGASNESNPEIYRVKNDVTYTVSLSEHSWDKWTPFVVPAGDELQLEFSMLSPFHRLPLKAVPAQSTDDAEVYTSSFMLPDQHGIFNFLIDYKRPFLTFLDEKITVSVRHMAHDEWPRSYVISGAWPWITGIGATVTGWLAFCALWMYSKPTGQVAASKKTQ
ncbi:oligosaccharyl transferase glycoprotein complex, beta subunit [Sporothrix bragantina]|uniref:Dolichyl-diphosphooligosaccharide--protein glycosyltransferase subunit WBP1 n=1 Tax=Sporothrix bragantina TaxID=671064 RepID=A0ABP0CSA5_9PEZI